VQDWSPTNERKGASRPALPSSYTSNISPNAVRALRLPDGQTVRIYKYGEYPQDIVSDVIAVVLEPAFKNGSLKTTGKKYTFDSAALDAYDTGFRPYECPEYTLNGKKYIRIEGKPADSDSVLSNGTQAESGKAYWVEVQPIEWLPDPTGVWASKKCLFAGIRFDGHIKYNGNFDNTEMKKYLDKYFMPQMQLSNNFNITQDNEHSKHEDTKRRIAFGINVSEEPLSVKEQIDFYVKTGKTFMLHGPSGIGKTARVYQADRNLTKLRLVKGILPEDVIGKVIYPSGAVEGGVWVPPDWYTELVEKCDREPDKRHVLFIDEITNVPETTQSLIFHIALEKSISNNKGILPKNSVVVLAGNNKEESGAAYNMPAPLFRRMYAHIYLEYNIPEWLEYGSEKSFTHTDEPNRLNVHPLVSAFIANNPEAFYSDYDEEEPEKFAIDPRGWEQVSDIVYDNEGDLRHELFANKIGNDMARHLLEFAKNPPLSLEEVLSGKYNSNDIPEMPDAQRALALSLRHADEEQVHEVREFIKEHLGAENCTMFDSLWAGEDDDRVLLIEQKMPHEPAVRKKSFFSDRRYG